MTQTQGSEKKAPIRLDSFITITPPAPKRDKYGSHYWTARVGDLEGWGQTKEDAINHLKEQIDAALSGFYTPSFVDYRGYKGIVWRTPQARWLYRLYWPHDQQMLHPEGKVIAVHSFSLPGKSTEQEVIRRMRNHLVDVMWGDHRDWKQDILTTFFQKDDEETGEDRKKFLQMCGWQERYTELKTIGIEDHMIREQLRQEGL